MAYVLCEDMLGTQWVWMEQSELEPKDLALRPDSAIYCVTMSKLLDLSVWSVTQLPFQIN